MSRSRTLPVLIAPIAVALLLPGCSDSPTATGAASTSSESPVALTATAPAEASVTKSTAAPAAAATQTSPIVKAAASASGDFVPAGYTLLFGDDFNGNTLDRSRWCTRYPYGSGPAVQVMDTECTSNGQGNLDFLNDEQQRYVDYNSNGATMHVVGNGKLDLMATRTRADWWVAYEAAMIRTKQTFRPDANRSFYVTSRMQLPSVIGTWPTFWLVPTVYADGQTKWPPEIDIMEGGLNGIEDRVTMIHMGAKQQNWGGWGPAGPATVTYHDADFEPYWGNYHADSSLRDRWVEIGLEWTDTSTCYFIDGLKVLCEAYRWVGNDGGEAPPATLVLNLAVGGHWAGRHGIDAASFPTQMSVDHVRVYEKRR